MALKFTAKQQKEMQLKYLWQEHAKLIAGLKWARDDLKKRGLDPETYMVPPDGSIDPMRTAKSSIHAQLMTNVESLRKALGIKGEEAGRCNYCLIRRATHFYSGRSLGPRYGVMGQTGCADPACDKSVDVWGNSEGDKTRHPYYWVTLTSKFGRKREQRIDDDHAEVFWKGRWVKAKWNAKERSVGDTFYPPHWEPARK